MPVCSRQIEQTAAEWLARQDADALSLAQSTALQQWLAQDSRHRVSFLRLRASWNETGRLRALGAGPAGASLPDRHRNPPAPATDRRTQMLLALRPRPQPTRRPRRARWFVAAAVAACALGLAWQQRPAPPPPAAIAYQSPAGQVRTLTLEDGSHATLSSDSRIAVRISDRARDVTLVRGEAIFTVAKDPQRPFTVAAAGYRAVAVGTRYSVRRDAAALRVVVTEGTVRLVSPSRNGAEPPSVRLPAGSVALVRGNGVLVRNLPLAQAQELIDWPSGMLAFHDAPLSEVTAEFNRFNARKLVVGDADAAALRVGGSFRWDNQDGFVRLLEAGFPVRAEANADRIVLHSR